MNHQKESLLDSIALSGEEHLIKLRGDLAMVQGLGGIGPGVISKTSHGGIYQITQQVTMNNQQLQMQFMFAAADVLWLSPAPKTAGPEIVTTGFNTAKA